MSDEMNGKKAAIGTAGAGLLLFGIWYAWGAGLRRSGRTKRA